MPFKILFVCMGNICRSPAAECVMRHELAKKGLEDKISCDSAGTLSSHSGEAPDHRMREGLRLREIKVCGTARQVKRTDLEEFDLILAMDGENLAWLKKLDRNSKYDEKLRLFGEFCKSTPGAEVPDPYYGGQDGFETVLDMLVDGCDSVIEFALSKK